MTRHTPRHHRFVRTVGPRYRRRADRAAGRAADRAIDRTGGFVPRQLTILG